LHIVVAATMRNRYWWWMRIARGHHLKMQRPISKDVAAAAETAAVE
jgi:hypothetical protein